MLLLLMAIAILLLPVSAWATPASSPIYITHAKDMPPLSFLDENDAPAGLVIDIWREWGRVMNIPVKFRLTTWKDTIKMIVDGDADVHGGLFFTPERAMVLDFVGGYMLYPGAYYIAKSLDMDDPAKEHEHPMGIVARDYAQQYASQIGQTDNLIIFPDTQSLYKNVSAGKTTFFLSDTQTAEWYLRQKGIRGEFRKVGPAYTRELHPAIKRGNSALVQLINEGMRRISPSRKTQIVRRWIPESDSSRPYWWDIAGAVVALILVAALSIFISGMVRRGPSDTDAYP